MPTGLKYLLPEMNNKSLYYLCGSVSYMLVFQIFMYYVLRTNYLWYGRRFHFHHTVIYRSNLAIYVMSLFTGLSNDRKQDISMLLMFWWRRKRFRVSLSKNFWLSLACAAGLADLSFSLSRKVSGKVNECSSFWSVAKSFLQLNPASS